MLLFGIDQFRSTVNNKGCHKKIYTISVIVNFFINIHTYSSMNLSNLVKAIFLFNYALVIIQITLEPLLYLPPL